MSEKEFNFFAGDSKVSNHECVSYTPRISSSGVVFASPREKNEKCVSYAELRRAVIKMRKN